MHMQAIYDLHRELAVSVFQAYLEQPPWTRYVIPVRRSSKSYRKTHGTREKEHLKITSRASFNMTLTGQNAFIVGFFCGQNKTSAK